MAKIFRALLVFSIFAALSVHAATTNYTRYTVPYVTGSFETKQAACEALKQTNTNLYKTATVENNYCNIFGDQGQSYGTYPIGVTSVGCIDPQIPNASGQCEQPPPTCSFGQILLEGVCSPIPCPAGTSYQRDTINTALEIYRCLDNCPSNTVTNMNPVTHIQTCGIADIKTPETSDSSTCPETKVQIGFDGSGKAICMNAPGKDPCPKGTHNISADIDAPNCTSNSPSPPSTVSESKAPTETKTNTDGSIEKKDVKETTFPDGSKKTETTTTTTTINGGTTTSTTTQCSKEGACGGSTGSGGSGGGSGSGNGSGTGDGDDKPDNPVQQKGDLYAKKEKTFAQVLTSFNTTVKASPFIAAASNYFTVSVGSGACPSWKATVPYLNMVVDTGQYFCTSLMSSVFGVIAAGLMLAASYVAFRWAFL